MTRISRLAPVSTIAAALVVAGPSHARGIEYSIDIGVSERSLDWTIAGTPAGTNPNILSELIWSDIRLVQIEGQLKIPLSGISVKNPYFIRLEGGYGWIFSGDNQDSDYLSDNRQDEFSRSNNSADGGEALNYAVALGIDFYVRPWFTISPEIGYAHHELNLEMTDGNQTIDTISNDLGPFPGLDSSYDAEREGVFVGLATAFRYSPQWRYYGSLRYSWNDDYEAVAQWNLRPDFQQPESFRHVTNGSGYEAKLGVTYYMQSREGGQVSVTVSHKEWEGDPGIDYTFFSDATYTTTRLNEVNWDETSIMFNYSRRY